MAKDGAKATLRLLQADWQAIQSATNTWKTAARSPFELSAEHRRDLFCGLQGQQKSPVYSGVGVAGAVSETPATDALVGPKALNAPTR
jgi:hypothetical protein